MSLSSASSVADATCALAHPSLSPSLPLSLSLPFSLSISHFWGCSGISQPFADYRACPFIRDHSETRSPTHPTPPWRVIRLGGIILARDVPCGGCPGGPSGRQLALPTAAIAPLLEGAFAGVRAPPGMELHARGLHALGTVWNATLRRTLLSLSLSCLGFDWAGGRGRRRGGGRALERAGRSRAPDPRSIRALVRILCAYDAAWRSSWHRRRRGEGWGRFVHFEVCGDAPAARAVAVAVLEHPLVLAVPPQEVLHAVALLWMLWRRKGGGKTKEWVNAGR